MCWLNMKVLIFGSIWQESCYYLDNEFLTPIAQFLLPESFIFAIPSAKPNPQTLTWPAYL